MTETRSARPVAAQCHDVAKSYTATSTPVTALDGVSLAVAPATLAVVWGPSGSGKSSLLRLLAGLDRPDSGTVLVGDVDISALGARQRRRARGRLISYVFQRPTENLLADLTIAQQLALAARLRGVHLHEGDLAVLDLLGIAGRAHHRPGQLSGGEQQRAALAAAVVGHPALVIADEPTAELDAHSGQLVLDAITALTAAGQAVIVASHDAAAAERADQVLQLRDGRLT